MPRVDRVAKSMTLERARRALAPYGMRVERSGDYLSVIGEREQALLFTEPLRDSRGQRLDERVALWETVIHGLMHARRGLAPADPLYRSSAIALRSLGWTFRLHQNPFLYEQRRRRRRR